MGCAYCGLPIPQPWWPWISPAPRKDGEKAYCCFGCRFAAAVTRQQGEEGAANWTLVCLGVAVLLTMNVMVFTMALWTQDFYRGEGETPGELAQVLRALFRYLCLLFAFPVILLLGLPLLDNAWDHLRHGLIHTDLLLVIGVVASYLYSVISVVREDGSVYFEVGCMVLVLVTVGRWLEARGRLQTLAAIDALHRLLPALARLLRDGEEVWVPLEAVHRGDQVLILPGERIPCDGQVMQNAVTVDEQALTGESTPAIKEPGDAVCGGQPQRAGTGNQQHSQACQDAFTQAVPAAVPRRRAASHGHDHRQENRGHAVCQPFETPLVLQTPANQLNHPRQHGIAGIGGRRDEEVAI